MGIITKTIGQITGWLYISRRRIATAAVVVLAGLVAFHAVFGPNGVFVYTKKRTEFRDLDSELKALKLENERLTGNIKALRTDPKTIEREAREQLRYTRPGEVVYALPAEKTAQTNSATAQKR
ncbi:MAG TPA: septum formation initiator family protein [Terriglobales bacterium]|nr:septum formation initiator family protein [Terriglobales bacterium]